MRYLVWLLLAAYVTVFCQCCDPLVWVLVLGKRDNKGISNGLQTDDQRAEGYNDNLRNYSEALGHEEKPQTGKFEFKT